ncbi:sensor histidine kinase [Erysipelothrix sp. HDW6C]|uniref:sensor histidine kinase n=1 Tax=Erysipelothrix sp. HDW6C TaxID=2714930 RepID=UPI001F0DC6A6|nr:GHKL domain-containing protein [Erysipelothrix sp. HDW6C]
MLYWVLIATSTIALYFYTYLSVYFMSDFASLRKHGYFTLALSMILNSLLIVWSRHYHLELYRTFLSMLIIMWFTFRFSLTLNPLEVSFAAVRHVFYFFAVRSLVMSLFSFLTNIPMQTIDADSMLYTIVFQISILLAIVVLVFLKNKVLTTERLRKLLDNRSQLLFVVVMKYSLGSFLMFTAYGAKYMGNSTWYALMQFVTSLLVIGVAALSVGNSLKISEMMQYEKQTVALQKQLDLQVSHYKSYQKYTESFREFKHDYKKMLSNINALLRNNEYQKAIRLLDDMGVHLTKGVAAHREYSNDVFLDAILQAFANQCESNHINFKGIVYWNESIQVEELKVVRIFNNLLENAFDAVMLLPEGQRSIAMRSNLRDHWLDVEIINSYNGELKDGFASTKSQSKQSRGLGVKIVNETMADIGGIVNWNPETSFFKVRLSFPRTMSKDDNSL